MEDPHRLLASPCIALTRVVFALMLVLTELVAALMCEGERVRTDVCPYALTTAFGRPCAFSTMGSPLVIILVMAMFMPERLFNLGRGSHTDDPAAKRKRSAADIAVMVSTILIAVVGVLLVGLFATILVMSLINNCTFALEWIAFATVSVVRFVALAILLGLFGRYWHKIRQRDAAKVAEQ